MLQNDRAGIAALPVFKSLVPARHLSKTFGGLVHNGSLFGDNATYTLPMRNVGCH
jgi:hypothetical protein